MDSFHIQADRREFFISSRSMMAFLSLNYCFHFSIEHLLYEIGWFYFDSILFVLEDDWTLDSIEEDISKLINIHLNGVLSRFPILIFEGI